MCAMRSYSSRLGKSEMLSSGAPREWGPIDQRSPRELAGRDTVDPEVDLEQPDHRPEVVDDGPVVAALRRSLSKRPFGDRVVAKEANPAAPELPLPGRDRQGRREHLESGDLIVAPPLELPARRLHRIDRSPARDRGLVSQAGGIWSVYSQRPSIQRTAAARGGSPRASAKARTGGRESAGSHSLVSATPLCRTSSHHAKLRRAGRG